MDNDVLDIQRMFLGDQSAWFVLEIAFRTGFMFVYTLVLVRTTGKRGLGELTPFELLLVVALGSAVGDPMLYPDVPLLHAMVVVTVVVLLQRSVALAIERFRPVERLMESTSTRLISDGVVDVNAMRAERLARDELFMMLREDGVEQLGQVKRAYLEPSGRVSVWLFGKEEVLPGLPLIPEDDPECQRPLQAGEPGSEAETFACVTCGSSSAAAPAGEPLGTCDSCESEAGWIVASMEPGGRSGQSSTERRRRPHGPLGR